MKKVTPKKQESNFPRLSAPAQRALTGAGVQMLEDLAKFSEEEVKQWHGIGPNAMDQLRRALAEHGLSFASEKIKKT